MSDKDRSAEAKLFPLDFASLRRGDYLPPETVETAVLAQRSDPTYRIRTLALRDEIRMHFQRAGDIATVVFERDGLRILTHQEQADYAPAREARGMRQILTARIEGGAVDLAQLGDEQRQRHERWLLRNSWRAQQLLKPPPPELK